MAYDYDTGKHYVMVRASDSDNWELYRENNAATGQAKMFSTAEEAATEVSEYYAGDDYEVVHQHTKTVTHTISTT